METSKENIIVRKHLYAFRFRKTVRYKQLFTMYLSNISTRQVSFRGFPYSRGICIKEFHNQKNKNRTTQSSDQQL